MCITHGAKMKRCTFEGGCANQVQKGGVCITHGAKLKRCSAEGCNNQALKGGVCITHGASRAKSYCRHDGCTNQARKGGVCITHGSKRKQCIVEGCNTQSQRGGVCYRHRSKGGIVANSTPTLQPNADTPPTPSRQSLHYEDEEGLNSWIWTSSLTVPKL